MAIAASALLVGCALPPNTALRDWARMGSVLADHPDAIAPPDPAQRDGLVAQQEALAIYLYALSVLAKRETPLTFRDAAYAPLVPRAVAVDRAAGAAVATLGTALATARAGNFPPHARDRSAGSATVLEDLRLGPLVRSADPAVQTLVVSLSRGTTGFAGPEQAAYRQLLTAIGEGHALLTSHANQLRQREVSRDILAQDDRLRRLLVILQPDAAVGLRADPAGMVGAVVQP